jgi:exodeoxyribonuclease (lambda-induced)
MGGTVSAADCVQGTAEWLQARVGFITASCMADVFARGRDGKSEGVTRKNYRAKLVVERLTGVSCDRGYKSKAMLDGNELEPLARAAYEIRNGVMVDQVGFIEHPTIAWYGCSPDGLVGTEGGMQIKCGFPATHIQWFKAGVVPTEHKPQMFSEMNCTDRKWWDFVSFCPELPDDMQLLIARLFRDGKEMSLIEDGVMKFNGEIAADIEEMTDLARLRAIR